MIKSRIEIAERGVMFTDYFGGTSGVMLPISVDNKTTLGEIVDSIEYEIGNVSEHVDYTAEYHNFQGDLWTSIYDEIKRMREYIHGREDMPYDSTLDFSFPDHENLDDEYPMAIFTIEFME